jgi:hypothetical protein
MVPREREGFSWFFVAGVSFVIWIDLGNEDLWKMGRVMPFAFMV